MFYMNSLFYRLLTIALAVLLPAVLRAESDPPFALPPRQELQKIRSAEIQTSKGAIYVRLFPEEAPWHVANLKYLADRGFYRNLPFHIYEQGFVIQTGAPGRRVNSGPGYTLPAEFNEHKHEEGALSMVRKPDDLDMEHTRRSHGSQFRILMRSAPNWDGQYVVFGKVVKGMDVVRALRQGDRVKELHVFVKADDRPAPPAAGEHYGEAPAPQTPAAPRMPPPQAPF